MKYLFLALFSFSFGSIFAQDQTSSAERAVESKAKAEQKIFPERCLGVWEGMMYIYQNAGLRDSVKVKFTAARTDVEGTYTWKTEYLSPSRPVVKDYKLVVDDLEQGRFQAINFPHGVLPFSHIKTTFPKDRLDFSEIGDVLNGLPGGVMRFFFLQPLPLLDLRTDQREVAKEDFVIMLSVPFLELPIQKHFLSQLFQTRLIQLNLMEGQDFPQIIL